MCFPPALCYRETYLHTYNVFVYNSFVRKVFNIFVSLFLRFHLWLIAHVSASHHCLYNLSRLTGPDKLVSILSIDTCHHFARITLYFFQPQCFVKYCSCESLSIFPCPSPPPSISCYTEWGLCFQAFFPSSRFAFICACIAEKLSNFIVNSGHELCPCFW